MKNRHIKRLSDKEFNYKVGETLRWAREKRGLTLMQVGSNLYIDFSYIASIERGKAAPLELLVRLAEYYNISLATIFQENPSCYLDEQWLRFINDMITVGITAGELKSFADTLE